MTTVVWFYLSSSKSRESMEHSIRLAQKNIQGVDNWIVIGDKPPSDSVQWIVCPKISATEHAKRTGKPTKRNTKALDLIWKPMKALECKQVADRWLWIHDDHFVLKPVSFEELFRPRSRGITRPSDIVQNGWREWRRRTFLELQNRGLKTYDYSDHQIIGFEKSKLKTTLEAFDLLDDPLLIETIYGNHHHARPELLKSTWFFYVTCASEWPKTTPTYVNLQNGRWEANREKIIEF